MTVWGILILIALLWVIPTAVGAAFANVDKKAGKLHFMWISGQIVLWAGFQLLSVPIILKKGSFKTVIGLYLVYMVVLLILSGFLYWRRGMRGQISSLRLVRGGETEGVVWKKWAWLVFGVLLLLQLYQAVFLAYADGDDSFYVAISAMTENSDNMYQKIPYTGAHSDVDVRHGMAPFPIWIAFLGRLSGMNTATVAHIVMPLLLIPMTYGIYYMIGRKLFAGKRDWLPVFLIVTELLVLFGDYSFYTVETFMIARSRQGKAALGSIIIPMLFLLLLLFLENLQEQQRISWGYWILLAAAMTAGCLCSTLGALLVCMLIGITGLCAACSYKKWRFLIPMATCCMPCVIYAGLYLILG